MPVCNCGAKDNEKQVTIYFHDKSLEINKAKYKIYLQEYVFQQNIRKGTQQR